MGDPSVEVTEENRDASQEAKGKSMEAISEGVCVCLWMAQLCIYVMWVCCEFVYLGESVISNWNAGKLEEAIEHLTEAILLNPTSAIMYATRGIF